jgi:hypothetical protein
MSTKRAKSLIAGLWVLSFVICFPPLVGWKDHKPVSIEFIELKLYFGRRGMIRGFTIDWDGFNVTLHIFDFTPVQT